MNVAGPPPAPTVLVLYPFRFRDPVTGKWVKARYVCDYPTLARRYEDFARAIASAR